MNKVVPSVVAMSHSSQFNFMNAGCDVNESNDDVSDAEEHDLMRLCIRGVAYVTDVTKLMCKPNSRMDKLREKWRNRVKTSEPHERKSIFLHRNPTLFQSVLDYYITGQLHLPDGVCGTLLKQEMQYWKIEYNEVAPCCLWKLREGMNAMEKLTDLLNQYTMWDEMATKAKTWREKMWIAYLLPFKSVLGKVTYCLNFFLYTLFVLSLTFQTMPDFRFPIHPNVTNLSSLTVGDYFRTHDVDSWLKIADFVLLLLITLSIAFFVAICPNRKEHFFNFISITTLLSVLYQWLPVTIVMVYAPPPDWYNSASSFLNSAKVARIFPIFGLLIPFRSMRILAQALVLSKKELGLLLVLIMISVLIFGYLVFVIEVGHEDTHFRSIPDGLWWGIVTLTTVGYGDLYPQTLGGRLTGVACAIVGIIVIALPVPIIAGNFTKMYDLVTLGDFYWSVSEEARKDREKDKTHAQEISDEVSVDDSESIKYEPDGNMKYYSNSNTKEDI